MVGAFFTNYAVRSGTNRQLCCRFLIAVTDASGILIQGELNKTIIVNVLYAPNKPALPEKLLINERCLWTEV